MLSFNGKSAGPNMLFRCHAQNIGRFLTGVTRANLKLSYMISRCHGQPMSKHKPNWRDRALAIEFWMATALVGGAFVVGAWQALKYLL